jgi:hypothetical protein
MPFSRSYYQLFRSFYPYKVDAIEQYLHSPVRLITKQACMITSIKYHSEYPIVFLHETEHRRKHGLAMTLKLNIAQIPYYQNCRFLNF